MNIGLYQSAASLTALERWQEAVTQNITSASVPGFKKRTIEFSGMPMGQLNSGASNSTSQSGILPMATIGMSYSGGEMVPTGKSLDMAIQGDGFFQVQTPSGQHVFTRSGEFHVNADRALSTTDGNAVLSDTGTPITLQADAGEIAVAPDGTISQTTSTGSTQIGKVGVFTFADKSALTGVGNGLFVPPAGVAPTPVETPAVAGGYLEQSNVSAVNEMISLVEISRAYEANQKMITSQDDTMQHALDALG
jgi:flagellar basal-body rod protein FlgF